MCDTGTKGRIEIGLRITSGPGRLSNYTKIVTLSPRYVIINRLFRPIKVVQDLGFGREAEPVEIPARAAGAFDLLEDNQRFPQVTFEIEDRWEKTCPVLIDKVGTEMVRIRKKMDLKDIAHITTRGCSQYDVDLPFLDDEKELGIQFETDWGQSQILVKKVVNGKYASLSTDIQVMVILDM